jgi:LEA14-like dessication related protein
MLKADIFDQKLEVRLRVQNPNKLEIPVRGLDVDMELAGEPFAHGMSAREFTVPGNGEAEFDMIVTANAATALIKILGGDRQSREAVEYRLKGKLSTRLGMLRSIPFEETGTLPIGSITEKKNRKTD